MKIMSDRVYEKALEAAHDEGYRAGRQTYDFAITGPDGTEIRPVKTVITHEWLEIPK